MECAHSLFRAATCTDWRSQQSANSAHLSSFRLNSAGYRKLRELCSQSNARFYLTTIAEGGQRAFSLLTQGRSGLPPYHALGEDCSLVLPLTPQRPQHIDKSLEVRSATPHDVAERQEMFELMQPQAWFERSPMVVACATAWHRLRTSV